MQDNILIQSLKLITKFHSTQTYASPSSSGNGAGPSDDDQGLLPTFFSQHGFTSLMIDPQIDCYLRPVYPEPITAFSDFFLRLTTAESDPEADLCELYLEQHSLLRCLDDQTVLSKALRSAKVHAVDVHRRLVISAWLRYERHEDEFDLPPPALTSCSPTSPQVKCLKSTPRHLEEDTDGDLRFIIGGEEVLCVRSCIASLSSPLNALLYGGFAEAQRDRINFTENGISIEAMKALDFYSRTKRIENNSRPEIILELLFFSNKFCCEELKSMCDARLASLVHTLDDAMQLIEQGLEETTYLLVAACLECFLRELPTILQNADVVRLLGTPEGKKRLQASGNASFVLYYFLSQVAMKEDFKSNITVMLLERLVECASSDWQKQQALHQLGCVMLEREEYKDAHHCFHEAAAKGHVYSVAGFTRVRYKRGQKDSAYKLMSILLDELEPVAWMYQERSLYCAGTKKMADLNMATEMDPTLTYPYKYRAISLLKEDKPDAAIAEINKILKFRVTPDCLELRYLFYLAMESYESAMQDLRALMTLDPKYCFFHQKVRSERNI